MTAAPVASAIHPTALVDPGAALGAGVDIGPFAIVGPGVTLGDGCRIGPRATIERNSRIGPGVVIGAGSIVGGDPQDLKFRGEDTWVEIGADTVVREYSTINRGTAASGVTRVGERCFLMSYVHLAHDCQVGNDVIIANGTQLAGHVEIGDRAILSGLVAVHQFVTIGSLAFVGGCSRVNQDTPPFVKAVGNPVKLYGLNGLGLQRAGVTEEAIFALKQAYRAFFNSDLNHSQAAARVRSDVRDLAEVRTFVDFIARSSRGVPS